MNNTRKVREKEIGKMLSEKDLKEIEMIYKTQVDHGMRIIQLNKIDFGNLLETAKKAMRK